ncbi:class IV adenylate cyclase [Desulfonatronum thioautotrophicum]|uniref:class IV adenylate cyclase n=1 Tax=Desulfonatronum thioautotrophicum TaxID=617001 RepID=UPI0005EB6B21|nr:class IV adenylate cyclase [Desulfonatronum thioautotrophicum]
MPLEIEIKYLNPDLEAICRRLSTDGATFISCHFEENWLYDNADRRLTREQILLRLRRADVVTLTVKKKPKTAVAHDPQFKVLEELETQVDDLEAMQKMLEALGYGIVFQYEKLRATWLWESCTICLDMLPFTQIVELEGTPTSIERAACRFNLDKLATSALNYVRLYQEHCYAQGQIPDDRFLFPEKQQQNLRKTVGSKGSGITPCAVFRRPDRPKA